MVVVFKSYLALQPICDMHDAYVSDNTSIAWEQLKYSYGYADLSIMCLWGRRVRLVDASLRRWELGEGFDETFLCRGRPGRSVPAVEAFSL